MFAILTLADVYTSKIHIDAIFLAGAQQPPHPAWRDVHYLDGFMLFSCSLAD